MPHINDKIDFTVEVFIVHNNKVLLRKHDKYKIWLGVGGHVELDEDPTISAVREVSEEVGLDVRLYHNGEYPLLEGNDYRELIPPAFMNRHRINPSHEHVTMVYLAASDTDNLVLSEEEKSDGCKWFSKEELHDPQYGIRDHIRMYAEVALQRLSSEKK